MRARILTALAVMLLLPLASTARIVVVYSLSPGERPSVEDARKLVALLNDPATAADGAAFAESKGLGYKTAEGNAFTPGLAAPDGAYGYYWSDGPTKFVPGFKPAGGKFETAATAEGARGAGGAARTVPVRAFADAFSARALSGGGLRLSYTLAAAGRAEVSVISPAGRTLARWSWTEGASGVYRRDVTLRQSYKGPVFVHYRVGEIRAVQRLRLTGAK